jgi:geranylgeranyl reductase family protein
MKLAGAPSDLVLNEIRGACIHSPTGKTLTLGGGKVYALVIDRIGLDRMLARQAQEQGAKLSLNTRLAGIQRVNGTLSLLTQRNGHASRIDTHLVIGADGTHSVVAGRNGCYKPPNAVTMLGAEAEVEGTDREFVHVYLGPDVAPGWFGWVIPVDGTRARIGVGTSEPGHDLHKLLANLVARARPQMELHVGKIHGGLIPLAPPERMYARNVLLVGDAAGQVKPTSGGGVYPLMVSARLCARAALTALQQDDFSERTLSCYQRDWDSVLRPEIAREHMLRRLFVSLTSGELDALLEVLRRDDLSRIISQYGDIDLQSSLFSHLLTAGVLRSTSRHLPGSLWPKLARLLLTWGVEGARNAFTGMRARVSFTD